MKDIPAFPFNELNQQTGLVHVQHFGMTLRDYFAEGAMQSAIAGLLSGNTLLTINKAELARFSIQMADAMLAAREAK